MFSERDVAQMKSKGISPEVVMLQIDNFRKGFPAILLDRPACVDDGIISMDRDSMNFLAGVFDEKAISRRLLKFVPASGAATRMFKDVFSWRSSLTRGDDPVELTKQDMVAATFFRRIQDFAFWDDLAMCLYKEDLHAEHLLLTRNYLPVLDFLLEGHGLDYAYLPKGLILFHRYDDHCRTAMEEHLSEGALYARDTERQVRIHFTVSPDHLDRFKEKMRHVRDAYEKRYQARFEVSWSIQKPSTDTIAVDMQNNPLRESDGSLVFRPGGHGALIENLNDLDADLVYIKNIDNVVPDHLKEETVLYKKVLGGLLIEMQERVHHWMRKIDAGTLVGEDYTKAIAFVSDELFIDVRSIDDDPDAGIPKLRALLNRPIRVCGMVRNEGEPGGGPFWVRDPESGALSLQIVETSQINLADKVQKSILNSASHFNPVDLVCATKDYKGKQFDLQSFVDPRTGFVSQKSKDGKALKALELPGLWNGSMANWITLFVEVPIITFNPVKIVNDLLRTEHQQA